MIKRLPFLLSFLLLLVQGLYVNAQISVTSVNMPKSGDTIRFSNANTVGINISNTGANTNWDYTSLKPTSQGISSYVTFLQTPYLFYSQFFGAIGLKTADTINLGILTMTNVTTFYKNKSSGFTAEGSGFTASGIPLASDYSSADMVYKFPLNFNNKDTSNFRVATSIPTLGSFIQQGTRYNHVDGWGKISTPYANNVNCIRILSNVIEIDSLKTSFINFGFPVSRREIKWLSNTEKIPMLEVTGALLGTNFTPTQVKYRDSYNISGTSGINSLVNSIELLVLPNPVEDYISIQPKDLESTIDVSILNLQGAEIMQTNIAGNSQINIAHLPTGRYILLAKQEGAQTSFVFDKR